MDLAYSSILEFGLEPTADVLTRGFSDYLVKIVASPAMLAQMARVDSVDLGASVVAQRDGKAIGVALVARRGWTSRIAGMAIIPEARRSGVGRALLAHLRQAAMQRGERVMVLEVIEQNHAAVKLYEGCGFQRVRRLVGVHRGAAEAPAIGPEGIRILEEVDLRAVGAQIVGSGGNLPWQVSGESIAQLTPPVRGYQWGEACIAVGDVSAPQVGIRGLAGGDLKRGDGPAGRLLRAVIARHPGREWRMGALWPEEWAEVFTAAGFVRMELSQWQMEWSLLDACPGRPGSVK